MKPSRMLLILTIILANLFSLAAQECAFYYPQQGGASLVYRNYDKKLKTTGKTEHKIISYKHSGNVSDAKVKVVNYDKKDKLLSETEMEVKCKDGVFYFDMRNYLNPATMSAYQDMEMEMNTTNLEFPASLKTGDKLKDGSLTAKVSTNGFTILTIKVTITDRIVEGEEEVTTSAGKFSCYKISQKTVTEAGLKIMMQTTEWISPGVGLVKSESYNKNGDFQGGMELTEFSKN